MAKKWGKELWVLREIQRQFPYIMPSTRLGHAVNDLTTLRRSRAAQQPHCISPSTFVVLFGMDQESPNGAQNMEVGWQPKNERETAKCLWSSSQTPRLCNPFGLSCNAALTGAEAGARTRNTANWPWRWNYCSKPALIAELCPAALSSSSQDANQSQVWVFTHAGDGGLHTGFMAVCQRCGCRHRSVKGGVQWLRACKMVLQGPGYGGRREEEEKEERRQRHIGSGSSQRRAEELRIEPENQRPLYPLSHHLIKSLPLPISTGAGLEGGRERGALCMLGRSGTEGGVVLPRGSHPAPSLPPDQPGSPAALKTQRMAMCLTLGRHEVEKVNPGVKGSGDPGAHLQAKPRFSWRPRGAFPPTHTSPGMQSGAQDAQRRNRAKEGRRAR
ncbi:unnamed protein product [Pleuronectes platessa]|uniref:Uncharacterized protein n=1 Tax=Pleuronectes platessa TaxID=8262 RepID=A0A9N7YN42_PLEPL|nr:unnamed protein product [Pleuronectes platessa]